MITGFNESTYKRACNALLGLGNQAQAEDPQPIRVEDVRRQLTGHTERVQPDHVQPGHVQPGHVQPGHVQPGHVQPGHVQPGQVQPGQVQASQVQPGHVQAIDQASGHTEHPAGHIQQVYTQLTQFEDGKNE